MEKETFTINETQCGVYYGEGPAVLLVQPVDEHEMAALDRQITLIREGLGDSFLYTAFKVHNWNRELSPWCAPAVFGPEPFGDGAADTLGFITEGLLPYVYNKYLRSGKIPVILGGYSLAGFFSLWSSYQTDIFSAAAAVSPSVWFPGWMDFAKVHKPQADYIYLSLGDKEEKTKNKVMSAVGGCIRTQQEILTEQGIGNTLEWNSGNHFKEPDVRCAKGFIRCVNSVLNIKCPIGGITNDQTV